MARVKLPASAVARNGAMPFKWSDMIAEYFS
jgi:hypothetical protein